MAVAVLVARPVGRGFCSTDPRGYADEVDQEHLSRLSPGQRACLRLVHGGFEAKEIAVQLGITVNVVNEHLRNARRQLGVTSSRQAARLIAIDEGLHNSVVPKPFGIADQTAPRAPLVPEAQGDPAGSDQPDPCESLAAVKERTVFHSPLPMPDREPRLPPFGIGGLSRELQWWQKLLAAAGLAILIALFFAGLAAVMAAGLGALSRS